MKAVLFFFVLFILASLLIKFFNKPDSNFEAFVATQNNPFFTTADSCDIMWDRAKAFVSINRLIIAAGKPRINDSIIVVPYASSHDKGNALRIERKTIDGRVRFICEWWYSRNREKTGGKEIALYIQKGVGRYDR
jgi:hypothetical protein